MSRKHKHSRPLFHITVYGIIGITLLLLLLPPLIGQALRFTLPRYGMGAIEVGNIDLNLFSGRVAFDELRLYRSAAQVLHLEHGELDFEWRALLQKRLQIRHLSLQGLSLTLSQSPRAPLRIAGFALPTGSDSPEPAADATSSDWGFAIDALHLEHNRIHLIRPGLAQTLVIERFDFGPLKSWEADTPSPLKALLHLNETQLQLEASATPLAAEPAGTLRLQLSPLELGTAQPLLPPAAGRVSGQLSAELELSLNQRREQLSLRQSGNLTLQGLRLLHPLQQLTGQNLRWQGTSELLLDAESTHLLLDGTLGGDQLTIKLTGNGTEAEGRDILWQGKGTLQLDGQGVRNTLNGTLSTNGLALRLPGTDTDTEVATGKLSWQGSSALQLNETATRVTLEGSLDGETLALKQPGNGNTATTGHLNWQGSTELTLEPQGSRSVTEGSLRGDRLALQLPGSALDFSGERLSWQGSAAISAAETPEIRFQGEAELQQATLGTLDEETPHTTLARLLVPQIRIDGLQDIELGTLQLQSLQTRLRLTTEGMEPLHHHLPDAQSEAGTGIATATSEPAEPPRLRLAGLSLDGDTLIHFEDTTVSPRFAETLAVNTLTLGALDNHQPARTTPLALQARLGAHSQLSATGQVTPFATPLGAGLEVTLQDYEMPPLSPYLVRLLGYRINSGQLDNTLTLTLADNSLQGETQIKARQLQMQAEDPDRIAAFEQKSTLPLNTALGLLRDKQGNIDLTIPFSGALDDPQFDLSDAINTALAKAMRSASVSYLKYLLQPYGSVITLVQLAGKAGGGVQLDPVLFTAGSAEPGADAADYLKRLAKLFAERKNLQLRLCGIATTADLIALSKGQQQTIPPGPHEQLEELARARAAALKQQLVEQYQLAPGQLFICNPTLDREAGAEPRVQLQL